MIDGKTLIRWGLVPGPAFKHALALARRMDADGAGEQAIRAALAADAAARAPMAAPPTAPVAAARVPTHVRGAHDERTLAQLERCTQVGSVVAAALCADGHLGYAQPVGGVVAYERHVSVSGVGYDIACGNLAVRTDLFASALSRADRERIALDLARNLSFGVGRVNAEPVEDALLDDADAWRDGGIEDLRAMAAAQLGTIGSGNHYVDLFADEADRLWVGVHFGSRGLGAKTATRYLELAGGRNGIDVPPAVLETDSELGRRYLAAMRLCGRYAYAGRDWVVARVLRMLGAGVEDSVHNHHNFAWEEQHEGRTLWVVRKGATPAFAGQRGFVGGSMADDAVILEGVDSPEASALLRSTVHGAGRLFGRNEAKRRFTAEEMRRWVAARGVVLRGAGVDESPMAYRRLDAVLAEHAASSRILHRLRPIVVVMAGEGEADPYRD